MASVYRGVHGPSALEVAIKILDRRAESDAREHLRREVQAHASLDHPGIVRLFEYGELELRGRRRPFVAMELAHSTIRARMPFGSWSEIYPVVMQILDALAYSHARGVIHRDLKPENFLVFDLDPTRVKLADFGIAHAIADVAHRNEKSLHTFSGTPPYTSPEQAMGRWRNFGPWTDLYSLGCIVYEFVCGRPPFVDDVPLRILMQHTSEPRPNLEPVVPVPDGLNDWIHQAISIDPGNRFRFAADAALALPRPDVDHLDSAVPSVGYSSAGATLDWQTIPTHPTRNHDSYAPTLVDDVPLHRTKSEASWTPGREFDRVHPPIPEDWRAPGQDVTSTAPGLSLFDLRETPFVDRDDARDTIWSALRETAEHEESRVILLDGEAGAGKSRLVDWMGTRAEELGAATVLKASHSESGGGPEEGVEGMVRRVYNAWKLDRTALEDHLHTAAQLVGPGLARSDLRALGEWLSPIESDTDSPRLSRRRRWALVNRLIEAKLRERAVIVWLDDLQWGRDARELLSFLFEEGRATPPALFVATVRSESLTADSEVAAEIEEFAHDGRSTRITIGPLEIADQKALIARMLPLKPELAEQLLDRTEGNPLFATQLLGDLVRRGELIPGEDGYRVADESELALPDTIHDLWMARLEALVRQRKTNDEETWEALLFASVLGRELDSDEWKALCDECGVSDPASLRDELIERGLATRLASGWAFAHTLLVNSLQRRVREEGILREVNRRCARLLTHLHADDPGVSRRIAEHWIAGGDPERAVTLLLALPRWLRRQGDAGSELRVLKQCAELLDELEVPEDDLRSIEVEIRLASAELMHGSDPAKIMERLEKLRDAASHRDEESLVCMTFRLSSLASGWLGDLEAARDFAHRAVEHARRHALNEPLFQALVRRGTVEFSLARYAEAEAALSEAFELASAHLGFYEESVALFVRGQLEFSRSESEQAAGFFEQAMTTAKHGGYSRMATEARNAQGEVARLRGDGPEARAHYEAALESAFELGMEPAFALMTTLNLAMVAVMEGRTQAAGDYLDICEAHIESRAIAPHRHTIHLARAACLASQGDWTDFERIIEEFHKGFPSGASRDPDLPWLLEICESLAIRQHESENARHARRAADRLWDQLSDS